MISDCDTMEYSTGGDLLQARQRLIMITKESLGRDIARVIIWYPLRWLVLCLPRIEWSFPLFRAMGSVHHRVSQSKSRQVREAFSRSGLDLTPAKSSEETRRFLQNHYESSLLVMLAPRLDLGSLDRCHGFRGLSHLDNALSQGQGAVIIHPHMGPAQLPMIHLGALGHSVVQVGALALPEGLSRMGQRVVELRRECEERLPSRIVSPTRFLRPLFDTLSHNGIVFIPGDGSGFGRSYGRFVRVPFLGKEIPFPTGGVALASKTNAALLPLFTRRDGKGYVSELLPPFAPAPKRREGYKDGVTRFAALFEERLRIDPGLWLLWDEFPFQTQETS